MRPGSLLGLLAAIAVGVAGLLSGWKAKRDASGAADRSQALQTEVTRLEEENLRLQGVIDRMARAGAVDDPEAVIRGDLEKVVGELRALGWFKRPNYKIVTRQGVRDLFLSWVDDPSAEAGAKMRDRALALEAMGWVDPGFDLKKAYRKLFSGEATAHFDETRGQVYAARGAALEEAEERVLLVHELARALADQHYDLKEMLHPVEGAGYRNSDMILARRALASGDASLLAAQYNRQYGSPLVSLGGAGSEFGTVAALLGRSGGKSNGMETLYALASFPHGEGRRFCEALHAGEGFVRVDEAYGFPPASTAEILHPELYLSRDFVPRTFVWSAEELAEAGGGSRELAWEDVAGELGVRLLLRRHLEEAEAATAAAGWHGDRYLVFGPGGKEERAGAAPLPEPGAGDVLWVTDWTGEDEAEEFLGAMRAFLRARYGLKDPVGERYDGERFIRLQRAADGAGVVLVDAGSDRRRQMLEELIP